MDAVKVAYAIAYIIAVSGLVFLAAATAAGTWVVGAPLAIAGVTLTAYGWMMKNRIDRIARKRRGTARARAVAYAVLLMVLIAPLLAPVAHMDSGFCSPNACRYRNNLARMEYYLVFLTILLFALGIVGIVFSRTPLGGIVHEMQGFVLTGILGLILLDLLLVPIHVVYQPCTSTTPGGQVVTGCTLDMQSLITDGPPAWRTILRMVLPRSFISGGAGP